MALALLFCAFGAVTWLSSDAVQSGLSHRFAQEQTAKAEAAYAELVKVRTEKRAADAVAAQLRADLKAALKTAGDTQRSAAAEAERAELAKAQKALGEIRTAHLKAEAEIRSLRAQLERQSSALEDANEAKRVSEEKLAVVSAAEAARQREEAQRQARIADEASPDEIPMPTKHGTKDSNDLAGPPHMQMAAAPPAGPAGLETSATGKAREQSDDDTDLHPVTSAKADDDDDKDDAQPAKKRIVKRSTYRRSRAATRREAPPPTYMVRLREVPWPYSAWYK